MITDGKNSNNDNTQSSAFCMHISKVVKAASCIIKISICAQQK